jgi:hypothetical protein
MHGPLTSSELGMCLRRARDSISPRIPEMTAMGVVAEGPKRKCTITGQTAQTWEAVLAEPKPLTKKVRPVPRKKLLDLLEHACHKGVDGEWYKDANDALAREKGATFTVST